MFVVLNISFSNNVISEKAFATKIYISGQGTL